MPGLLDAAADLLLGGCCAGCGAPGRSWCAACDAATVPRPRPAWPTPTPVGLREPWAASSYDGAVREAVLSHKERGVRGLERPLGGLLAEAVLGLLASRAVVPTLDAPVLLVPVPSRPAAVRSRGRDTTAALVRPATDGAQVVLAPLLRLRGGVADQAGLDRSARAANLEGSMHCPARGLARLARRRPQVAGVVVCDDVVTTGATLVEAQRALSAVGLPVLGAAVVAATVRRAPPS